MISPLEFNYKPFGDFEPLKYYKEKLPKASPGWVKNSVFTVVGLVDKDAAPRLEFQKMTIDYVGNLVWRRLTLDEGEAKCNANPECRSFYNYWKQSLQSQQQFKQRSRFSEIFPD